MNAAAKEEEEEEEEPHLNGSGFTQKHSYKNAMVSYPRTFVVMWMDAGNNSGAISSHPEVKRAPKKKKKTMVEMEETILR